MVWRGGVMVLRDRRFTAAVVIGVLVLVGGLLILASLQRTDVGDHNVTCRSYLHWHGMDAAIYANKTGHYPPPAGPGWFEAIQRAIPDNCAPQVMRWCPAGEQVPADAYCARATAYVRGDLRQPMVACPRMSLHGDHINVVDIAGALGRVEREEAGDDPFAPGGPLEALSCDGD